MIEYHGWLNLSQSQDGEAEESIEHIFASVRELFAEKSIENENFVLNRSNGQYFVHFSGCHNHVGERLKEILAMLTSIGSMAAGSYGLVYFRDEEDEIKYNEFVVYKMVRGIIKIERDKYLSPCNPVIED